VLPDRIQVLFLKTAGRLYHVEKRLNPIPNWNSDEPPAKDMTKEDLISEIMWSARSSS
jgi:hypothetical protein